MKRGQGQALWFVVVYAAMAAGILAAAGLYERFQAREVRRAAAEQLEATADLKVRELAGWRAERIADAAIVQHSTFFQEAARAALEGRQDPKGEKLLAERTELYRKFYGYHAVAVVDREGTVRFGSEGATAVKDEPDLAAIAETMATGEVVVSDFHYHRAAGRILLGIFVPVEGAGGPAIGAIVMQIDPQTFLYPLIQSWPVASASAETLLVRREGNEVLYLNDLRHRGETALLLRMPLARGELPASMAVGGREGVVVGRDYRGVPVMAVLRRIPDSPWFMVAKEDEGELFAPLADRARLVLGGVILLLVLACVALVMIWRRQQALGALEEREKGAEKLAQDARRTKLLFQLAQQRGRPLREVTTFALEACVALTRSTAGFFHFYDEQTGELKLNTWSKEVMPACRVNQDQHYPLEKAGIWADCVRRRAPVIVNDYQREAGRKGYPAGHFPVRNFLSLPVFEGDRIVMICGVGNKEAPYEQGDVDELTIFMTSAWSILREMRAEEELARSRRLLDDMGAIARLGGWEVDVATGRQTWTSEVYAIHEVGPDYEPTAEKGIAFYAPEAQQTIREILGRAVEQGAPFDTELPLITAKGNRIWVRAKGEAVREGDKVVRVRGIFQDISERKKAEEQLERYANRMEQMVDERTRELEKARAGLYASEHLSALGRMGAGIAHQFNTPIGAGMLYADALLERCTAMPEQHAILEKIRDVFADMRGVVDSMLALARVRRRGEAEIVPVEINAVLGRVLDMSTMECNAREVKLETSLAPELPPIPAAVGDLEQVFLNLITNAIDAMPGGGKLTVTTGARGDGVEVRVEDTGRGIEPENLEKIFEPFFTTREGGKGTGLGLAIAHEVVERYGGTIAVESEAGRGTIFTVALPLSGLQAEEAAPGRDKG